MTMREAERRVERRGAGPSLRLGLVGGMVGAATCFVAITFSANTGPATAHAAQPALEDRPRGLISAADQRIEIIQRLDRINANLEAMRLMMERQAQKDQGDTARKP